MCVNFLVGSFRQFKHLGLLALAFTYVGLDYFFRKGWRWGIARRALWLRFCAGLMTRALGFEIRVVGTPPSSGFITPNHLGYMDILVLGSIVPQVFLSRSDVQSWPIIGAYTKMAGTLFIDRKRRSEVASKDADFANVIEAGVGMTYFLEGTSSDGLEVFPFRASLLEPVVRNGWLITPAYLKYECEGGDTKQDVCWWGDMEFGSHILRMAKLRKITATVVFGETRQPGECRKKLAIELHESVVELRNS